VITTHDVTGLRCTGVLSLQQDKCTILALKGCRSDESVRTQESTIFATVTFRINRWGLEKAIYSSIQRRYGRGWVPAANVIAHTSIHLPCSFDVAALEHVGMAAGRLDGLSSAESRCDHGVLLNPLCFAIMIWSH
jgi:hypothetical protein